MGLAIDYTPPPTGKKFMESDAKMRVLMGPVGCIAPETLVVTEHGLLPIARIDRPMRVLSWNETTCRFQLSWCGGAFPKGTDYLYRVTTQQGEFAANEHHRVFDGAHAYQPVGSLAPGQFVSQYCGAQALTDLVRDLLSSQKDAPHLRQIAEGSLARYAVLARQYGLQLLQEEGIDLAFVPELNGAQKSALCSGSSVVAHKGGHWGRLLEHTRLGLYAVQSRTGGLLSRAARLLLNAAGLAAKESCAHIGRLPQTWRQSALKNEHHRQEQQLVAQHSFVGEPLDVTSISKRPIVEFARESVKRSYWDLQVLDTNNYVTVDGTIHHNSGKSITSCFEIVRRASMQAPNKQGIRKTRCAVVRETVRQLQDTTIKSYLDWFPSGVCGDYMKTTKTYFFKVGDVECEIMFRALDDADDVANLNSLELTFAWFNECRDIHPDIVDAMSKRIGRYPSAKDGGPTWHGMWGDTNPPTIDTWWYYQMEHLDPKDGVSPNNNGWAVFKQPSGRGPYAENIANLPEGYYDTQGRSEEYIRVYIDGEYGLSSAGTPVYKYFRPDYHMAKGPLRHISNGVRPIIVGMDLGLTPAAVIGQQDPRGRALVLAEAVSFDMGVQRFVRTVLKPLLYERFSGVPVLIVVDPAGVQRAQTDERSAVDIIKAEGLRVIPARTNNISARINAVDEYLMRQVDGDPAFLLDPRCTHLKAAMMGGYRFKPKGDGDIDKNKHSHCFVAGTLVSTPQGQIPIEDIVVGDTVLTPFGEYPVTATMSSTVEMLVTIRLDDGTEIVCTPDHPFYTANGIVLAEALQYTDVLLTSGNTQCPLKNGQFKSSTESGTTANPPGTTSPTSPGTAEPTCTAMFGRTLTDLFRKVCRYITATTTRATTRLRTLKLFQVLNTLSCTWNTVRSIVQVGINLVWKKPEMPQHCGTDSTLKPKKDSKNCLNKVAQAGKTERSACTHAPIAALCLSVFVEQTSEVIAALRAKQRQELPAESITKYDDALYALVVLQLIDTGRLRLAPKIVAVSVDRQPPSRVYDLTVSGVHSFYANNLWVSNCAEALQYLFLHIHSADGGTVMQQRKEVKQLPAIGWT